ncbi:MAG: hypothetical protein ACYSWX_14065, partial [Planctomycetota bacterium]
MHKGPMTLAAVALAAAALLAFVAVPDPAAPSTVASSATTVEVSFAPAEAARRPVVAPESIAAIAAPVVKPPAPEPKATPEPEPEPAEPSTPSPSSTPSEAPPVDPSESRTIAFSLQILNDRGRSIPNLDVVLSPHTSTDASDTAPTASLQGRSDASGRVTFVEPVTPGEWDLELPDGLRKLDPLGPIVVDD